VARAVSRIVSAPPRPTITSRPAVPLMTSFSAVPMRVGASLLQLGTTTWYEHSTVVRCRRCVSVSPETGNRGGSGEVRCGAA
jgi:hypothetical protein